MYFSTKLIGKWEFIHVSTGGCNDIDNYEDDEENVPNCTDVVNKKARSDMVNLATILTTCFCLHIFSSFHSGSSQKMQYERIG